MVSARAYLAVTVNDGVVYAMGGVDANGVTVDAVEILDTVTGKEKGKRAELQLVFFSLETAQDDRTTKRYTHIIGCCCFWLSAFLNFCSSFFQKKPPPFVFFSSTNVCVFIYPGFLIACRSPRPEPAGAHFAVRGWLYDEGGVHTWKRNKR